MKNFLQVLGFNKKATQKDEPAKPATGICRQEGDRLFIRLDAGQEMEFIRIPSGEFWMGSDPNKDPLTVLNEKPQHKIILPDYWIGRFPVTNQQYRAFVQATGYRNPQHWEMGSFTASKANHPVDFLNWEDGLAFCTWLAGKTAALGQPVRVRLPSEAEWEKAARGPDGRIFPWGDEAASSSFCNFNRQLWDTSKIGYYSPEGDSPYGCVDMAGNVYEWTASLDQPYPYLVNAGREDLTAAGLRVARGGSWADGNQGVRAASRGGFNPADRVSNHGFRCAA